MLSPETTSSSSAQPALDAANEALDDLRLSIDSEQNGALSKPAAVKANGVNGKATASPRHSGELSDSERLERVRNELERTKEEKEALATQYHSLLAKLNTMRTTVGNKLKQDAVSVHVSSI